MILKFEFLKLFPFVLDDWIPNLKSHDTASRNSNTFVILAKCPKCLWEQGRGISKKSVQLPILLGLGPFNKTLGSHLEHQGWRKWKREMAEVSRWREKIISEKNFNLWAWERFSLPASQVTWFTWCRVGYLDRKHLSWSILDSPTAGRRFHSSVKRDLFSHVLIHMQPKSCIVSWKECVQNAAFCNCSCLTASGVSMVVHFLTLRWNLDKSASQHPADIDTEPTGHQIDSFKKFWKKKDQVQVLFVWKNWDAQNKNKPSLFVG